MLKRYLSFIAILAATLCAAHGAIAADPAPDPLAAIQGMVGNWEGTGKGPFGPYYVKWSAIREGRWIVTYQDIYDKQGGTAQEHVVHVYGVDLNGKLTCDTYDGTGKYQMTGEATATGGKMRAEDGGMWREFTWTTDGDTISGVFHLHNPNAKDPFPKDFEATETDHRLPASGN